ncbi:MAG: methionyl-tRNA formyltransferase [Candidatus Omnitrophica bacterium]|nr:methionyl-tRNA formyltransferase [Candidatus Omnitrophota bacterium]
MPTLRIVFLGTAELACPILEAIAGATDFQIVGVVTQPDRPKGRDLHLLPPPVKELAMRLGLPVFQPDRLRSEGAVQAFAQWHPDLILVTAYGQILPPSVLALPAFGCLNVHASLLPKYRGAAPIQWALLNDEAETGVTIMKMDEGLDTGPILSQQATPISPADDAQTLHDRLAQFGARLLLSTLPDYLAGKIAARPQPAEGVTHAPKIHKENGRLDWRLPARVLWNQVRALTPWPGAFTYQAAQPQPQLLKIWQTEIAESLSGAPGEVLRADSGGLIVACGRNALRILELQREGKRRLNARTFLAGSDLQPGQILG